MPRATVMRKSLRILEDLQLVKVLKSEISHELSSTHFQESGSLDAFTIDWDSPQSQDVVLRRKVGSGEEVAVSALLGKEAFSENTAFPTEVLMKVCLKKPGLGSILQFDCGIYGTGVDASDFRIYNAHFLHSPALPHSSIYKGPPFSDLDPKLQDALKDYLAQRGIASSLTNFLLSLLHQKEQKQYINWLQQLESFVGRED